MTALSPRFAADDLEVSGDHPRLVKPIPRQHVRNARRLARDYLEPLAEWAAPYRIRVTSGYRPPRLNDAVGGSSRSRHLLAAAADVVFVDEQGREAPALIPFAFEWAERTWGDDVGELVAEPGYLHVAIPLEGRPAGKVIARGTRLENPTPAAMLTVAVAFFGALALSEL